MFVLKCCRTPSIAPYDSKHQAQYSIYAKEPSKSQFHRNNTTAWLEICLEFRENLRMRLIVDIGKIIGTVQWFV